MIFITALTYNYYKDIIKYISIKLANTTFTNLYNYQLISISIKNCQSNVIYITHCHFVHNWAIFKDLPMISITSLECNTNSEEISKSLINIQNCYFQNNEYGGTIINFTDTSTHTGRGNNAQSNIYTVYGCSFKVKATNFICLLSNSLQDLVIQNTKFESSKFYLILM